mgnify:CR=1 FL=1
MKCSKYLLDLVSSAGLRIVEVRTTGSTHIKARLQRPDDGQCANFFFAGTPSERRGFNNKLAELKRFASGEYNPIAQRPQ